MFLRKKRSSLYLLPGSSKTHVLSKKPELRGQSVIQLMREQEKIEFGILVLSNTTRTINGIDN